MGTSLKQFTLETIHGVKIKLLYNIIDQHFQSGHEKYSLMEILIPFLLIFSTLKVKDNIQR